MGILTYRGDKFYMDGAPFTVRSGAMHYFRIPRAYWRDRLLKLKECGFNTVETYMCWNLHERREGEFDFAGELDIAAFVATAAELGLYVILRPGPFICSEWDFGGLPSWLLTYEKMPLRCYDEIFLSKLRRYYGAFLPMLRPYFAVNGGPIIMLQVENEYGSYGNDKDYLRAVIEVYRENGIDCLFFTSDGALYTMLSGGTLDECLATVNFGSDPKASFAVLSELFPNRPLMCGEYWCGEYAHWWEEQKNRDPEELYRGVHDFAEVGASFNFYMFAGGTNFGFTNGADYRDIYRPTMTRYYQSLLSEAGDRTERYYRVRAAMEECYGALPPMTATETEKAAYGSVRLSEYAPLFDHLDELSDSIEVTEPQYMEEYGQDFGYILYRTTVKGPRDGWRLGADAVHDRAQIFVNGEKRATWERWDEEGMKAIRSVWGGWDREGRRAEPVSIPLSAGESASLDILVENMGRVNVGPKMRDRKGMVGMRFATQRHFGWEVYTLPMDDLSRLTYAPLADAPIEGPVFLRGTLRIDGAPKDTFLRLDGFTKGFVTVNGKNIGRYYNPAGPQKTLYLPAPYLREGDNEIVVFESDATASTEIRFLDASDFD